jgi:hypothetical protein
MSRIEDAPRFRPYREDDSTRVFNARSLDLSTPRRFASGYLLAAASRLKDRAKLTLPLCGKGPNSSAGCLTALKWELGA